MEEFGYGGAEDTDGGEVAYTDHGQPYLLGDGEHTEEPNLTMSCTMEDIKETYGPGVYLYFDFAKACNWMNLIMFGVVLINIIPHLYYETKAGQFKSLRPLDYILVAINVQSYVEAKSQPIYFWTTLSAMVISFLMTFGYSLIIRGYTQQCRMTNQKNDFIKTSIGGSWLSRAIRILICWIICVIILIVSGVANFYAVKLRNNYPRDFLAGIITTSLVASISLKGINAVFEVGSLFLTMFEKHITWTQFRLHNTIKLYVFKVVNLIMLYIFHARIFSYYTDETIQDTCPLIDVGSQFLLLLLIDLTIQNVWEVVYSAGYPRVLGLFKRNTPYNDRRAEFDLAEEYVEILFRQLIIYMGMPVYPFVTIIGVICGVVDFYIDKYRMIKICRPPYRTQATMHRFLTFYLMLLTAALAICMYPYGSGWVLFQIGFEPNPTTSTLNTQCPSMFSRMPGTDLIVPLVNHNDSSSSSSMM
ncbi:hypothetical protein SAMD00019534_082870 [Acytostelium subglobosum LB1]|uniref:hypothetical protein n=1 Tax=Acytostelium subglobosum LB1 TaxID=1410327 RepID=UPI000644E5E8|nr:hypothetical protein SAMD00019534_082870 [Acytostelium subglobosum LB1]GAM25112.1 hypothetical protein SAMD00019534_082870 [Acytostelium subglobosum LB1]|eukprot:XP_012752201.1 hypothetical protein SAMD00019534_082870 [Acytostelium subglobosum LB1]